LLNENTLSARRGNVVSQKWYREGYFIEGWEGDYRRFNARDQI
jgi:hypothetical protein